MAAHSIDFEYYSAETGLALGGQMRLGPGDMRYRADWVTAPFQGIVTRAIGAHSVIMAVAAESLVRSKGERPGSIKGPN